MPIYTRKGDKGQTSLFNGLTLSKSHVRVEAYGTIDELNSVIGMINSKIVSIKKELLSIQNDLFLIGSILANPKNGKIKGLEKRVREFENLIDKLTMEMPKLTNFILPRGGKSGSLLHFARTVSRRAERNVVSLAKKEKVDKSVLMYLNRLSDLFFTMARYENFKLKKKEIIWHLGV